MCVGRECVLAGDAACMNLAEANCLVFIMEYNSYNSIWAAATNKLIRTVSWDPETHQCVPSTGISASSFNHRHGWPTPLDVLFLILKSPHRLFWQRTSKRAGCIVTPKGVSFLKSVITENFTNISKLEDSSLSVLLVRGGLGQPLLSHECSKSCRLEIKLHCFGDIRLTL